MPKLIMLTCNVSAKDEIISILDDLKINNFQIIEPVTGKLPLGDPRMNTAVWPGYSVTILISGDPELATLLQKAIGEYNDQAYTDDERAFVLSWDADNVIS
ncbi:MAG TPA: hypothetical protein PKI15_09175 [Candidatus Cloacimonadota bacterium]|nr:hypothetical protein [Candidatus Cloacimonadota bacterium]